MNEWLKSVEHKVLQDMEDHLHLNHPHAEPAKETPQESPKPLEGSENNGQAQ